MPPTSAQATAATAATSASGQQIGANATMTESTSPAAKAARQAFAGAGEPIAIAARTSQGSRTTTMVLPMWPVVTIPVTAGSKA